MAIPKSTQQFYLLTAFASLFTIIGVTITAVTITHILEESKGEEEGEEENVGSDSSKMPSDIPTNTPANTPVRSKVR
jgi:hypothetical protein